MNFKILRNIRRYRLILWLKDNFEFMGKVNMKKVASVVNIVLAIICLIAAIMNFTNSDILMEIAYIFFALMFLILGVKEVSRKKDNGYKEK